MKAYVVEKEALSHNIELLQKMANGVPIWAVLKGNGYGIGVLPLARHLAEAGIDHFCVTEVREAELLRENGFEDAAILMLRSTGDPAELNRLMDLRVILTIGSWETACAINAIAAERADVVEAHLKKDSKRNLPKALTVGGIIVIATYLLYYIGVTGGASNAELIEKGATVAFTNIFGNVIGNILNLFIAISCIGTMNGLMLACCRGVYSVAARGKGPATHMFSRVDEHTNMPNNSAVMGLLLCGFWGLYFSLSNLAGTWSHKTVFTGTIFESVPFLFDPTELPIITIYALYIPVFIQWIRKQKGTSVWQHYILPILAICGSVFMVIACLVSHGMGCFWYLIVFAFVMVLGGLLNRRTQRTVRAAGV